MIKAKTAKKEDATPTVMDDPPNDTRYKGNAEISILPLTDINKFTIEILIKFFVHNLLLFVVLFNDIMLKPSYFI